MRQVIVRLGFGASAMGALSWVLWPSDWSKVFQQPEPLLALAVAVAVWVSAEIFNGKNYSTNSPNDEVDRGRATLTENDLRSAQQILSYHKFTMRELLKSQDLGAYFDYKYLVELHAFVHANEESHFEFLDVELVERWRPIARKFKSFARFMSINSTPEFIGGRQMIRLDHHAVALMTIGAEDRPSKSEEGNQIASEIWDSFDEFVGFLKTNRPETTNPSIQDFWYYAIDRQSH